MKINIINKSQHALPNYETIASAGMDLRANLTESVTLAPLGEQSLKPVFYRITDRLRSTSTTKKRTGFQNGITVLNSPGTVDADYRRN
jgi:dUTP pyrophosphatase